jgi:hypothetical protein
LQPALLVDLAKHVVVNRVAIELGEAGKLFVRRGGEHFGTGHSVAGYYRYSSEEQSHRGRRRDDLGHDREIHCWHRCLDLWLPSVVKEHIL